MFGMREGGGRERREKKHFCFLFNILLDWMCFFGLQVEKRVRKGVRERERERERKR